MRYYLSECIDAQTGRCFQLRLLGSDEQDAQSVPVAWGFITSKPEPVCPEPIRAIKGTMISRGGRSIPASAVWDVTHRGDLSEMLAVRNQDCDWVDRHFFLQRLAETAYKERERADHALTHCEWACWQWLMEAPFLMDALRMQFQGPTFVSISVPKRLVILLEKTGHKERAAEVANACLSLDFGPLEVEYLTKKAGRTVG